ncbi:MAG: Adenosylcobinamide amidohydrolase [Myxococcales bacterium]|nr:Adenosylcobinamide amidohydrolase [Myxococcales bacterium]
MIDLALEVVRQRRMLVARFARRQRFSSWALVGGGAARGRAVAWCQVNDHELTPEIDACALLAERLAIAGVPDAVGLLTSSDVGRYVHHAATSAGLDARCVVTVGLGNRLRAGDGPGPARPVGTINLLCALSRPLDERAMVEATALCAEARAVAVLESGARSVRSGLPASGTGTDCQVIAAPEAADDDEPLTFVGKHTEAGALIGQIVLSAVTTGVRAWLDEHG